jgi:phenylpropionate dioxygenase-like ring-hydroxylating dioxygenase large terminal subunit
MNQQTDLSRRYAAASPEPSAQEILRALGETVPPPLDRESYRFLGNADIPYDRYTSQAFFDLEMERMWTRVWQWACREEHIAEPGDYVVYDIGRYSIVVTRTPAGGIKAFYNACLHRGTKLCASHGAGSQPHFTCPYHGWSWNLDGSLREIPSAWDFTHVEPEAFRLPEVRVETWGGFVFINMDEDAPPLMDYLGVLPEHFRNWNMADRYVALHVQKELPCNWKLAAEAFMENYHTRTTHPQLLSSTSEPSTQYDICDRHLSRFYSLMGVPSPHLGRTLSEQEKVDNLLMGDRSMVASPLKVEEGSNARRTMARFLREQFDRKLDVDTNHLADAEILDTIEYTLFPNMFLFPGLSLPMIYRFRPIGSSPDRSLFDLLFLRPLPRSGERPEPAAPVRIGVEDSYASVPGMDPGMGHVYDQDTRNLGLQQEGMMTSKKPGQTLATYQEVRIRHLNDTLDLYLRSPDGRRDG